MSDTMSQAEIDALLGLTSTDDEAPAEETPAADVAAEETPAADVAAEEAPAADIAAEEVPAEEAAVESVEPTLSNIDQFIADTAKVEEQQSPLNIEDYLTPEEIDLLGEVGNMCMGAVATTMYTLLDHRVSITTPRVNVFSSSEVLKSYQTPFVVVEVEYIEGIEGKNLLLLKEYDAMLITDLLMGGEGQVEEGGELNELHMSAISEVMNQMIGASATALSKILGRTVNISPPHSDYVEMNADVSDRLSASDMIIKISFDMEIEGLLNSQLLQLMPYQLGRELAYKLLQPEEEVSAPAPAPTSTPEPAPAPAPPAAAAPAPAPFTAPQPATPAPVPPATPYGYPPAQENYAALQQPGAPYGYPQPAAPYGYPAAPPPQQPPASKLVDVRQANYPAFDTSAHSVNGGRQSLDLVADIPLQVTVELGKAKKSISEILEFGIGTIVVLEKIAGEHVEVLVNGKLIAAGEVVVIDENYGVRITDIYE